MQLNEIVKTVMKREGITQQELADMVGSKQNSISAALSRPAMSGSMGVEMLETMGYQLCAVKIEKTYVGVELKRGEQMVGYVE